MEPEGISGDYPVAVRVSRNVADDRQVITIVEVDGPGHVVSEQHRLTREGRWDAL